MTTMIPDLVVGAVGFGPNFATDPLDSELVAELRAEVAELISQRNRLRSVLQKCAALSPEISDEKHEVLLATDPRNLHPPQEKPLP
jgi:hypothetical protein